MGTKKEIISNVYHGLIVYEGADIAPNVDPDGDGPRTDPETEHGRVSPQAISHRVYNVVSAKHGDKEGYALQIRRGTTIEKGILEAAEDAKIKPSKKLDPQERYDLTSAVCRRFFDSRMGGAVLGVGSAPTDGVNGVVTFAWGRSVYPVMKLRDALTRVCNNDSSQEKNRDMGHATKVAYGVYKQPFFVNPHHAERNGATLEDLAIYLDGLLNIWEHKRSVFSGMISMRALYLFRHESKYGNAPAHTLFDRVLIDSEDPERARSWQDYNLRFDDKNLPKGIDVFNIEDMLGGPEAILETLRK